ncbi:MAG: hypothetical protein Q4A10_05525 [Aerococcaceae bacterium]|nr:hypothetical protein [Aerococcaceae bacterium]
MLETLLELVGNSFVLEEILYHLENTFERAEEDEDYYKGLVELSLHYRNIGATDIAIQLLAKLYQIAPRNKVIYLLAQFHYELADYETALEWLSLLTAPLTAYKPLLLQARLWLKLDRKQHAKQLLLQMVEQFPTEARPYQLLAELYEQQTLYDQAERYYRILYDYFKSQIDEDFIRLKLIELALFHKEVLSVEEIERLFPNMEVTNADEAYLLALAYQKAENLTESLYYAHLAVELMSDFIDGHFLLLELYEQTGNLSGMHTELEWLRDSIPPYDAMIADLVPFATLSQYYDIPLSEKVADYYPLCDNLEECYYLLLYMVNTYLRSGAPDKAEDILHRLADGAFEPSELSGLYARIEKFRINERQLDFMDDEEIQGEFSGTQALIEAKCALEDGEYDKAHRLLMKYGNNTAQWQMIRQQLKE